MWEWSKTTTKKKKLLPSYNSLSRAVSSSQPDSKEYAPSPSEMQSFLMTKIRHFGLKNLELKECAYHPQTWDEMSKDAIEYQRIRKSFLKLIGYSYEQECRNIGFDDEDINLLKSKKSPENYNTHLKIPLDFGGGLSFQNLSLVKSHPCHDRIHSLIEMQIGNRFLQKHKIIYIPWFEGMFYHD